MLEGPFAALATSSPAWLQWFVAIAGFVGGFVVCAVMAIVEWGAWVLVLPNRKPGLMRATEDPALGVPIEITAADGVPLAGLWHEADVPTGRTVVLLHGFAEPTSLRIRIEVLTRHGWNVASLDARGHGRSGGDRASFGGREVGDLQAWIDAIAARVGTTLTLTAWGRSMGAGIVSRAAVIDPRITAVVLESPYLDLEDALTVLLRRYRMPAARLLARRMLRRAGRLAGTSLTRPRPIDVAPEVRVPVLIVHGAADALIPFSEARRLAETFRPPAELLDVPGGGHSNAIDVGGYELLDRIAAFLDTAVPRAEALGPISHANSSG